MYWWERFSGLHPREKIRRVYANFRSAAGGCDGATGFGFNGCLNVTSLFLLFQAIGLRGRNVVDLGAGEGRVMASALKIGAKSVVGYELPANSAHKYVYDAVLRRIFDRIDSNSMASDDQWLAKDIDQVFIFYRVWNVLLHLDLFWSWKYPLISSLDFPNKRKSSTLFGMECPIWPRFTFSSFQPAAELFAN